jgi:polysaccharide deacetylase family protein (PEP-CTERM system associated)
MSLSRPVTNAFTIDVESWFHILDLPGGPKPEEWVRMEDRETMQLRRLLDLLDRHGVRATCFVLGWTAEHRPRLLEEIIRRGHEVACHGYGHGLLYQLGPDPFRQDLERARSVIGDVYKGPLRGYRVPGFSLTPQTPWAFEVLADAGFDYDSSIFPGKRGHGGFPSAPRLPYFVELADGRRIREFPISMVRVLGQPAPYAGGGYLRLFPYWLIRRWVRRANAGGEPVILYIHPRDIDADQPRLPMPLKRRFKCYVNLHTTMGKLDRLLTDFQWDSAINVLDRILPVSGPTSTPASADSGRGPGSTTESS